MCHCSVSLLHVSLLLCHGSMFHGSMSLLHIVIYVTHPKNPSMHQYLNPSSIVIFVFIFHIIQVFRHIQASNRCSYHSFRKCFFIRIIPRRSMHLVRNYYIYPYKLVILGVVLNSFIVVSMSLSLPIYILRNPYAVLSFVSDSPVRPCFFNISNKRRPLLIVG